MSSEAGKGPEFWGGIECTVNRVGNTWFNQLERTGHAYREEDLDRIAALGVRTLRFPVLWELHEPIAGAPIDWRATDRRLARLRDLDIMPIAGLVHHGSGPAYTELLSEGFAPGLANFARAVARRYPWLEWYTPVNEPLTTARFSALYGLWYPHARSDSAFTRALVNQCRAIVLSMNEIRRVNRDAKLLQTEDLGKTYSTPHMKYQARFENQRRWLTWDLLCGRVDSSHPLRTFLLRTGISASELDWFQDNRCTPEMIGINHYVTSDRFLDEQVLKYTATCRGGNARESYADVEAVRALKRPRATWARVIREAARRYSLPLALTEVHLGCTREEQLRWLKEAWEAAVLAGCRGYDVRAVTAWALFGSVDWNTLLTRGSDHYESGAFDVSTGLPRETAVGKLIRTLCSGGSQSFDAAGGLGWWHRPDRILNSHDTSAPVHGGAASRPLLITGSNSILGEAFAAACGSRGIDFVYLPQDKSDLTDLPEFKRVVRDLRPWAVVTSAPIGSERLRSVLQADTRVVTFAPMRVAPADALPILQVHSDALQVHLGRCFAPNIQQCPIAQALQLLDGRPHDKRADAPTSLPQLWSYVPDVVDAALNLLIDGESGTWLLANRGAASYEELIARCAALLNLGSDFPHHCPLQALATSENVSSSEQIMRLPTLESAVQRFVQASSTSFGVGFEPARRMA